MKRKDSSVDLDFRPSSYWDVPEARFANVKGRARREAIERAEQDGTLDELPPEILDDEVSDTVREVAGAMHPMFMGGEYLPSYKSGEVEIARISLQSTTFDVISIRARRHGGQIRYRVVDEYESSFAPAIKNSNEPLSLGELVSLIEGTRSAGSEDEQSLIWGPLEWQVEFGCTASEIRDFVEVDSTFYGALNRYYEERIAEWTRERASDLDPEE